MTLNMDDWFTQCQENFGENYAHIACELLQDGSNLYHAWKLYYTMFLDESKSMYDSFMRRTAPHLFEYVQFLMAQHIILQLNRLTDPPKQTNSIPACPHTKPNENLTIHLLIDLAADEKKKKTEKLVNKACDYVGQKQLRLWKNKRISHSDKETRLSKRSFDKTDGDIEDAVKYIEKLFEEVYGNMWHDQLCKQSIMLDEQEIEILMNKLKL